MTYHIDSPQPQARAIVAHVSIVKTVVYGVEAFHADCLDCPWTSRRFNHEATAVRHAERHGQTHDTAPA